MLTVTVADGLAAVDADQWAALARGHGIYAAREWLLMGEAAEAPPTAGDWTHRYGLCTDGDRLAGALPLYAAAELRGGLYDPVRMHADFVADDADPARWAPDVVAGSRTGYRTRLLVRGDLSESRRQEVVRLLVGLAVDVARAEGRGGVSFAYLPAGDAAAVGDALGTAAVALYDDAELTVPVPATFEDYIGRLSRNRRTAVRRERAVFQASGATVRRTGLAEVREVVPHLYANLLARHGGQDTEARAADYIDRQAEFVAHRSVVWLCSRAGRPVAFSLFYEVDDVLFSRFVGFDYADSDHFEYFNLLVYEPMEYACRAGLAAIQLSIGTGEAKIRRGARPAPVWSVLLPAGDGDRAHDDTAARARKLNDERLLALRRDCASWAAEPPDTAHWAPPGWSGGPGE